MMLFPSLAFGLPAITVAVQAATSTLPAGCGNTLPSGITPGGESKNVSIESDGLTRSYLIHVPETYDSSTPVPLILSYHGRTKNASEQEELSQFSNSSYNPNAIAVYPQGVANSKGTRQWTGDPDAPSSVNDITFTSDLITNLTSTYCIDPSRVYAAGKSNGGGLVGLLACDPVTSAQIAAFAPVSGAFYLGVLGAANDSLPDCNPARDQIPILEFHGYADETIMYLGDHDRGDTIPIPEYMNLWAERDGLDSSKNSSTDVCDGTGYPQALRRSWGDGLVQHYNISNLEHDWPSQWPNDDDKSGEYETCFEATELIVEFFNQWTL